MFTGAAVCCYWSVRLGWADWLARKATLEDSAHSIALAPGNSAYLQYAAITLEDNGGEGTRLRVRTAQVNPLDSGNWIRLAARAEGRKQMGEAERDLQRAFAADRQFEPRWALANFYFRGGDRDGALQWARKALEFGGGDLNAVFELCWDITGDEREIFAKGIPARTKVLEQYLQYLDRSGRLDAASRVADKLLSMAGAEQEPVLAGHTSLCLGAGRVDAGIAAWNGLVSRGLLQGERVEPEAGKSLVNPNFERELTGAGFDWDSQPVDGVVVERLPNGAGVQIFFSRNEPESCVILGQYAALVPNREYRFRLRYATAGMSGAGTKWVVYDAVTKAVLVSAGPAEESTGREHTLDSQFQTPADCRLARIELRYAREPGTVRPEGSMRFSDLELEFAP